MLPHNFAERLLKLEEMCDQSKASSDDVLELIELYSVSGCKEDRVRSSTTRVTVLRNTCSTRDGCSKC